MTVVRRCVLIFIAIQWTLLAALNLHASIFLSTPTGYRTGVPFPVRVEVRDATGEPRKDLWDAEAILRSDASGVVLSETVVPLRNGVGTALITITGTGDFNLVATVGGEEAHRAVKNRSSEPVATATGTLNAGNSTWQGVVNVTGSVIVPAGLTLTIQPGTLVLVNGVSSGTAGISISVAGALRSLGTEQAPISITSPNAGVNWGQIRHDGAAPSSYAHTFITKAGRAPGEGHTGTGPALRVNNAEVTLDHCVISDLTSATGSTVGKVMMATDSDLVVRNSIMARARMGPEIAGTGLLCLASYFMEMRGPDDCDGIYLHNSGSRPLILRGCVFAGGDDDAIDTLNADALLEDCIVRDWANPDEDAKGVSVFHGSVELKRCLIVNCHEGISAKSSGARSTVRIDRCTISAAERGLSAAYKDNARAGNIEYYVTNSIVRAADAIHSDFGPDRFASVRYNNLSELWPGTGNQNADPLFVNLAGGDFRLSSGSPAIDAGDPASPPDPDVSRSDLGFYTALSPSAGFYVAVTEPRSDAIFAGPTNLLLQARAETATGTVQRVEFFEGGRKLGERTARPFELVWSNLLAGAYTAYAVASRSDGLLSTSAPVRFSVTTGEGPSTNLLIAAGSIWKYLDNGTDQGTAWRQPAFNDAGWPAGNAKLGYGDGDEATVIGFGPSSNNKYVTYYFRGTFVLDEDPIRVERLTADLLRDDGAIVYLNGQEVLRRGMPQGEVGYRTYATEASDYPWESAMLDRGALVQGTNLVAVEVHQGNASSSDLAFDFALTAVLSPPTNARPLVAITAPANGAMFAAPASLTVTANAVDLDGTVASIAFYVNDTLAGTASAPPFEYSLNQLPQGEYLLRAVATDNFGLASTSAVVAVAVSAESGAPRIAGVSPGAGRATNLSRIIVTFSKPVIGVNASDLLVNGHPALDVEGSSTVYRFVVPALSGQAVVTWDSAHGITDTFTPPSAFDHTAPGSTWQYDVLDTIAPTVALLEPPAGNTVPALNRISVWFSEVVNGVDAGDLLVNSRPASTVTGSGQGPYQFSFADPGGGVAIIAWANGHGIRDAGGNAFAGESWTYLVDPNLTGVVISEIMYHPASENSLEEYIELYNRGASDVNLNGWEFSQGVTFRFPDVTIRAGNYLVAAANLEAFRAKYPEVENVVGGWTGTLSNTRETIGLDDAQGSRIDEVRYADEGDWALRERGELDREYRGWGWYAEHDGSGKSIELINPILPNDFGQNWAASIALEGTPGRQNSVFQDQVAPLILQVTHAPVVPKSTDLVVVSARIARAAQQDPEITLHYRIDNPNPESFIEIGMRDDGREGDGAAGDGIYSARIPAQANNTVVEFYIQAKAGDLERTWPAPVIAAPDGAGPTGQEANALFQVDDTEYSTTAPLYKVIVRETERLELQNIGNNVGGSANSDAQMNATFISIDGTGTNLRYLAGVRNRGHGSRASKPNNFRVNFRGDDTWKGVLGINLNAQFSWLQVLGAALHTSAGVVGAESRGVQFRVNNANLVTTGANERTYGLYAANEIINSDWADRHFPNDSNGNIYRAIRDINPPEFDYRVPEVYPSLQGAENQNSYTNTFFKANNASEDDWSDLIAMLRVMGPNGTDSFTEGNVRRAIDPEQWLRHLAVMNLFGNSETGLNTGHNDDYYMYRGAKDPRFVLMYYDLDQILGYGGSFGTTASIYSATNNNGSGQAMGRLLNHSSFHPIYLETLRELIDGPFSAGSFNALVDQVLGDWVPAPVRSQIKAYMDARRNFVRTQLPATPPAKPPKAVLSAAPRSPTPSATAEFQVSGDDLAQYRYSINGGPLSPDLPVEMPIVLTNLAGGTNTLRVIGRSSAGYYQSTLLATTSTWVVDRSWSPVRINEVIAAWSGNQNDQIELHNESTGDVDLTGLRLTDNPRNPGRYTFGPRILPAAGFLVLDSSQLGFSIEASGEGVYLFDRASGGGALLDSVEFGPQIPDLSIGRTGRNGSWTLTQPTFGATNIVQPLGDFRRVRINEWLAYGVSPFPDDFVELYNPEPLPVAIGGGYLSDRRIGDPQKSPIWPLSFVAAEGYRAFRSGAGNDGDEINFNLPSEQGEIAYFAADLTPVDTVVYGPQRAGVSMGRCSDGDFGIKPLASPTPGGGNQCPVEPPAPRMVTLVPFDHVWKYNATGADLGAGWRGSTYPDHDWPAGPGLLGFEDATLLEPLRTTIPNTRSITYYFRARFEVDPALSPTAVELTFFVDDGAAFYLNGELIGDLFNLPPGATAQTFASGTVDNATPQFRTIPPDRLRPGVNTFAVEVHQVNASSSDMVFGLRLDALIQTNGSQSGGVIISEVMARNRSFPVAGHMVEGWVELHNPTTRALDLSGMSLSTDVRLPGMWVFPDGFTIPPGAYRVVAFDRNAPASDWNTGFSLREHGGAIYLFDSPEAGGESLSTLVYGLQAVDRSLSIRSDGSWALGDPSPGASNRFVTLGSPERLKINEWLADPPAGGLDWFELFNPEELAVSLEGLAVSDSLANPLRHRFPALSFMGPASFLRLFADNQSAPGADHVDFALAASGEAIALARADGTLIDAVSFGPQLENVSEGRLPDGGAGRAFFEVPTPGAPNILPGDSDGDGIPDAWELQFGLDPNDPADALLDLDGDGASNRDEFLAGTDPANAGSRLRLVAGVAGPAGISLEFDAMSGRAYQVLGAAEVSGPWMLIDSTRSIPEAQTIRLTVPHSGATQFFKVQVGAE